MRRKERPPYFFDAVIFDLDGVVTDTASVHVMAWKQVFDEYLEARSARFQEEFRPFAADTDYPYYVDGKPRYDGVRSFLSSRGVQLAQGDPSDSPEQDTICGLGNRKDVLFRQLISRKGVRVFEGSIHLIRQLEAIGVRRAIASSSKNCRTILQLSGIEGLFQARVDGEVSAELKLKGKPSPDIFLKCAEMLGVPPQRTVLVEDAIVGVQAGRNGGFGLVVGIDRFGLGQQFQLNGADVVLTDLEGVSPGNIDQWCAAKQRRPSVP